MRRSHLRSVLPALVAGAILLCTLAGLATAAGIVTLSEAPLNPQGEVYEVNAGSPGTYWISDTGIGELWQVVPDNSYTVYQGLGGVSDARPGAAGEVWFGSGEACRLRRLLTATQSVETFNLGSDCSPLATAYDGSKVWVADFANPRVYSFDGTNLCTYGLPNGGKPAFLALQAGAVWYGTATYGGSANGAIVRLDPVPPTPLATVWPIAASANPYGLAFSPDNALWWTDPTLKTVNRFDPSTNGLAAYALPDGSKPELLASAWGSVWYTDDELGAVGRVDPTTAVSGASTLTPSQNTVTKTCQPLASAGAQPVSVRHGTLPWTDGVYTATTTNGVTTYQLSGQAYPWGIAFSGNTVFTAARGRQVLARFETADVLSRIYLPFIHR